MPSSFLLTVRRSTAPLFYLLFLGACFFLWPVVTGLPFLWERMLWILCAAGAALLSAKMVERTLGHTGDGALRISLWSLLLAIGCGGLLLWYGSAFPPLTFSDVLTISLPGLTVATRLAEHLTWIGLLVCSAMGITLVWLLVKRFGRNAALAIFCCSVSMACVVALLNIQSGLALRYPPVVHLMQITGAILTGGALHLFRMANVLWTMLLIVVVWNALPQWPRIARLGILAGLFFGPLAWTYHIVLYQATGEITIGCIAILLLWRVLLENKPSMTAALGVIFACWFLYRPTSILVLLSALVILWFWKRRSACRNIASIAFPVIVAWLLLAPLFASHYGWFEKPGTSGGSLPTLLSAIPLALKTTLIALPSNLHPVGLAILLLGSLLVWVIGHKKQGILLSIAWICALASLLPQQLVVGHLFYGTARLNILLLLPLSFSLGCLLSMPRSLYFIPQSLATLSVIALIAVTPFDFGGYMQHLRATQTDVLTFLPPEGYDALPIMESAAKNLTEKNTMVILAPQYEFLDWFIMQGLMTADEKNRLLARSKAWTPRSTNRPVLVQAPLTTTYTPNLSHQEERALKAARVWAAAQPHSVEYLGIEEAMIVP